MRLTIFTLCALLLLSLSGCGAAAPDSSLTTAGTTSAAVATAPPTSLPTLSAATAPAAPTPFEETAMPTEPAPTPEEQAPREQPTTAPAPTRPAFHATPLASANAVTPATPPGSTAQPLSPPLDALVAAARADLAQRQAVALDAISTVEVRSVTWPDGGLGCPQPGMAYPQVQVDGVLIRLSVAGRIFEYHGGGNRAPFLCEQKS